MEGLRLQLNTRLASGIKRAGRPTRTRPVSCAASCAVVGIAVKR